MAFSGWFLLKEESTTGVNLPARAHVGIDLEPSNVRHHFQTLKQLYIGPSAYAHYHHVSGYRYPVCAPDGRDVHSVF